MHLKDYPNSIQVDNDIEKQKPVPDVGLAFFEHVLADQIQLAICRLILDFVMQIVNLCCHLHWTMHMICFSNCFVIKSKGEPIVAEFF